MKVNRYYSALVLICVATLPLKSIHAANIEDLTALANEFNDPVSQYLLGERYLRKNHGKRDIKKGISWFKRAADNGHTLAKYKLGLIYYEGRFVAQDYRKAIKYLKNSANKGREKSAIILGNIFDKGLGVDKDSTLAFKYYSFAANNYHPLSLYKVATGYFYGKGVTKNIAKAKEWVKLAIQYEATGARHLYALIDTEQRNDSKDQSPVEQYQAAAEAGDSDALYMLGLIYLSGTSEFKKDYEKAETYLLEAAEKGYVKAQETLGKAYYAGEWLVADRPAAISWLEKARKQNSSFAQDMLQAINEKKLNEALDDAVNKLRDENQILSRILSAANKGDKEAQFKLAKAYETGSVGLEENTKNAVKWYRRAAENSHLEAQILLGKLYLEGTQVKKDEDASRKWLELATEQGSVAAKEILSGLKQATSDKENSSITLLRKGAKSGDAVTQYTLAEHYYNGQFVERDFDKAALWYGKAAKQGHMEAQYQIGLMYRAGEGVQQNNASFREWLQQAARRGHEGAKRQLIGSAKVHLIEVKEHHLKAAFLFNFSKFATWPGRNTPDAEHPVKYCALGNSEVSQILEDTIFENPEKAKAIRFKRIYNLKSIDVCELLLIGNDDSRPPFSEIINGTRGKAIFTASDIDGFAVDGGMINLSQKDNRIHVILNMGIVNESKLDISANVKKLSTIITPGSDI